MAMALSPSAEQLVPVAHTLGDGKDFSAVAGERAGIQELAGSRALPPHRPQMAPGAVEHLNAMTDLVAHPDAAVRGRHHRGGQREVAVADVVDAEAAHEAAVRLEDLDREARGRAGDDHARVREHRDAGDAGELRRVSSRIAPARERPVVGAEAVDAPAVAGRWLEHAEQHGSGQLGTLRVLQVGGSRLADEVMLLAIEPERVLMLGGPPSNEVTWTFVLNELRPGVTRLIVRVRGGPGYRFHGLPLLLTRFVVRIVHFIMQRKQLLGIARRVERSGTPLKTMR